jgi:hypothetical protein
VLLLLRKKLSTDKLFETPSVGYPTFMTCDDRIKDHENSDAHSAVSLLAVGRSHDEGDTCVRTGAGAYWAFNNLFALYGRLRELKQLGDRLGVEGAEIDALNIEIDYMRLHSGKNN